MSKTNEQTKDKLTATDILCAVAALIGLTAIIYIPVQIFGWLWGKVLGLIFNKIFGPIEDLED